MPIEAICSALPSVLHTVEDIAQQCDAEIDFVRSKVGVEQRYILGPKETGVSLATQASKSVLEKGKITADQIGLIVFVTQNPDRRLPQNSAGVAEALGVPSHCASFDVSLGCSGYVYGLSIAEAFAEAQNIENALLITCDPYSRIIDASDKATNAVFGDAATATLLRRSSGRTKLMGLDFGTDGSGGDAIEVQGGGAFQPIVSIAEDAASFGDKDDYRLHMDGRAVFNFVNGTIPGSIKAALANAEMTLDDIDLYALHQGSSYMLDALARRARLDPAKVLKNIDRYGNTVSSTIPLLLENAMDSGALDRGGNVLVSGFGVGLSWATGILQFKEITT